MRDIFISILNMSYQAGIVIGVILIARFLLYILRAPKKYAYALWMIPFVRMICPFSVECMYSLLPKESHPIKTDAAYMQVPQVYMGSNINASVNQSLPAATPASSINPLQIWLEVFQWFWIAGIVVLFIHSVVSFLRLKKNLQCSIYLKEDISLTDYIDTPFVLGIVNPHIYLPSYIKETEKEYVLSHEKVHIKRGDHIIKILVFLITSVHWFNPLAWIAFILLCKDMEMSCDEAVMKQYGEENRKEYASILLNFTAGKRGMHGIPLAFGEGNTKRRIKNIMNYKKPILGVAVIAVVLIIGLMIGLLTKPNQIERNNRALKKSIGNIEQGTRKVYLNDIVPFEWTEVYTFDPYLDIAQQESIIGFTSSRLKQSVSEGMVHLVFVNEDEVVSSILAYPDNLGYSINLGTDDKKDVNYIKITYVQNSAFTVERNEVTVNLNYLTDENGGLSERVSSVTITPPIIQRNMNLGADAPVLDYAGNEIIIFHGYFGLFVYSIATRSMIGAVDLKSIGCDSTQGDNYCEVNVSSDGSNVYLHPISENDMYVYKVLEQTLSKEGYSLEGIDLFDTFADSSTFMDEQQGFCSDRGVEFNVDGYQYYGYLTFQDWTIDDLKYVEGDMIFSLFDSYFKDYKDDMLSSGLYAMNVIQSELTNTGATFQIFNNSNQEIIYGEQYKLQQRKDDTWIDVPYIIDNWAFTDIAYTIPANESKKVEVDWGWLYGNLPVGEYLFIKNIIVEKDAGNYDNIPLGVEFQISDGVSTENTGYVE